MPDYFSLSEAASCSGLFITQRIKGLKPTQVAVHCRGLRTLLGRCVVTANLKRSRFSQSRLEAATCWVAPSRSYDVRPFYNYGNVVGSERARGGKLSFFSLTLKAAIPMTLSAPFFFFFFFNRTESEEGQRSSVWLASPQPLPFTLLALWLLPFLRPPAAALSARLPKLTSNTSLEKGTSFDWHSSPP